MPSNPTPTPDNPPPTGPGNTGMAQSSPMALAQTLQYLNESINELQQTMLEVLDALNRSGKVPKTTVAKVSAKPKRRSGRTSAPK